MLKRSLFKPPVFLLLAAGLLSISAYGASSSSAEHQGSQISVSGCGKISAKADQASINLNLSAQAASSAEARKRSTEELMLSLRPSTNWASRTNRSRREA